MLVRSQPGAPKHACSGARRFRRLIRITISPLAVIFRPAISMAVSDRVHPTGRNLAPMSFDAPEAGLKRRLNMSTETRNSRPETGAAITA
ncbi:hypothetical protein PPH94_000780 [Burkholderia cepacia]|uniref:hypothetical protein n=1 Tax=Burkholderia cepacia TaxID=292 RepID=UPI001A0155AF|nr:hypothetical protein [Burkholderia cepacia]MDC6104320.1 hypothetical protein [Burkholderia cepacia]NLA19357.1 hypothetical protein [Burkholderia cepacia]